MANQAKNAPSAARRITKSESPPPAPQRIEAQRAGPGSDKIKKNKAVNDRQFTSIFNGPESGLRVRLKIGDSHFSRKDESDGPGEQSQEDKGAPGQFQDAGQAHQGVQRDQAVTRRVIEKFLAPVLHEQHRDNNPQHGQQVT
jgi:hypothetical protein